MPSSFEPLAMPSPQRRHLLPLVMGLLFIACGLARAQQVDLRLAGARSRHAGAARPTRQLRLQGGQAALSLNATFSNDNLRRASWDFDVNEDLTHCAGVKLRLFCERPEIVQQYNIYLKTGSIWQAVIFTPTVAKAWHDLFIPKALFSPEGQPQSWKNVSTIRIALWKGAPGQTTLAISHLEFVRPNGRVAIVRSGREGHPMTLAHRQARALSLALNAVGVRPALLEEDDTTYLNLRPYDFVYMPSPAQASPEQCTTIANFVQRGGKAAVFHSLPPIIQQAMAFPAGRYMQTSTANISIGGVQMQRQALHAARNFVQNSTSFIAIPKVMFPLKTIAWWQTTSGETTLYPAIIESPHGFWMTHSYLGKDDDNAGPTLAAMACRHLPKLREAAARTAYQQAASALNDTPASSQDKQTPRRTLEAARNCFANQQYETCVQLTNNCLAELAACGTRPLPAARDELRAIWCHYEHGLPGHTWQTTAQLLAQADVNALFVSAATPLTASYPSRIVPLITSTDAFSKCADACRVHGIQLFAWLNCLSLKDAATSPQLASAVHTWAQEGRLQKDFDGQTIPWLCPSQIRNRTLIVQLAAELAASFKLDGICLDFIRFPSSQTCCCDACRQAFEMYTGVTCAWPADIRPGNHLHQTWQVFRQRLISSLVQEIANATRQASPHTKVAAAVFPHLESARLNEGQNWSVWLSRRTIDLACPMAYQPTDTAFKADIQRQQQLLGPQLSAKLLPSIGLSTHNLTLNGAQKQLFAARQLHTAGVILFKLDTREAQEILPSIFQQP